MKVSLEGKGYIRKTLQTIFHTTLTSKAHTSVCDFVYMYSLIIFAVDSLNSQIAVIFRFEFRIITTVKPVLRGHSKKPKTRMLMTNGTLMKVESIAECSPWSILQYF